MRGRILAFVMLCAVGFLGAETPPSLGGLINPEKAKALMASDKTAVLLDVRTAEEFNAGHIAGAKLLPYDEINAKTAARNITAKNTVIIVYCRSGRRSAIAAASLRELGYKTVWDLGGIQDWPYEVIK
jgi:rhodanese-related sulfurtransferase